MLQHGSKRKIGSGLVAAIAAATVVSACSSPTTATGSGTQGKSGSAKSSNRPLVVGLIEAPDVLDPTTAQTFVGTEVFANMCEGLYTLDDKLDVVPQLAAAMPKVSKDGLTYTIKLRSGVKFNDGTPFNAAAVKKTLDRDRTDKKSARTSDLAAVKAVQVVDPTTVKLTLSHPYAPLTNSLTGRSGMIESPKQLEKLGNKFGQHPVCVGPFSFKSRPSSDEINLVKSTYYYDKDKVKLPGIQYKVITQPNVRAANLRAGSIDLAARMVPAQVKTLESDSKVKLKSVTSLGYQGVQINVSNSNGINSDVHKTMGTPLAQHPELRKAFALSLDRKAINKAVFNGMYTPGCTPISPVSPFFTDIKCPEHDVAKAKKLVAQSGVKTPVKVKLIVQASNDEQAKLGQVIQGMAKQAGFDVKVVPTEFTTALADAQKGHFDTFQLGWSGGVDPDGNIRPFWDPSSPLNFTGADYPDITKLIHKAASTTDVAKRKALYRQLVKKLMQRNNLIYLYHERYTLGMRSGVSGVKFFGDGIVRLKTASLS